MLGTAVIEDVVLNKENSGISHCVNTRKYREPLQYTQKANACFYCYISHIRVMNTIRISQQTLVNLSLLMLLYQLITFAVYWYEAMQERRNFLSKLHP